MKRLAWVDICKAICMMSVYLLHSGAYYVNGPLCEYWLRPFYVNAFFFVSGYLLFGKLLKDSGLSNISRGGYKQSLQNTLFRLIVPTIVFASLVYLPKMLFHNSGELSFGRYMFDVFGGVSFWFTSALAVSQILMLTLFAVLRSRSVWLYVLLTVPMFVVMVWVNNRHTVTTADVFFPWYYSVGVEYSFIMVLGGLYRRYEEMVRKVMTPWGMCVVAVAYVAFMALTYSGGRQQFLGMSGRLTPEAFFAVLCGIALVVGLSKTIPAKKWMVYIGENSIVFYFFSGVLPAMFGMIARKLIPGGMYIVTVAVAACSVICGFLLTMMINRYLPFLTDLRKISEWKRRK